MEDNKAQQKSPDPLPTAKNKSLKHSKLVVPIVAGIVLLAGVGAAAFNANFQNSPDKIWSDALSNTADGLDAITKEAENYEAKGLNIEGSFALKAPIAADGQITGQFYEKNALLESNVGVSGMRIDSEIRSILAEGNDTPDLYVYVEGLEAVQGLLGQAQPGIAGVIEQVNGQWILIDRTLVDQGLKQLEEASSTDADAIMLEKEDLENISRISADTINDYIFTEDETRAVFQVSEELGEEEFDGVSTYKYEVIVDKENLKTFVTAYKDALKETQFDEYVVAASETEDTFEEVIEFDNIIEKIDATDFSQTKNEAWVDLDERFIRNIRITPTEQDPGTIGYIEFALPYDGGDVLPFTFRINTGKEEASGNKIIAEFVAGYNQANSSFELSFDIAGTIDKQDIDLKAELTLTPSDEEIEVEKPADATNILEIIGQLQTSGLPNGFTQSGSDFDSTLFDNVEL